METLCCEDLREQKGVLLTEATLKAWREKNKGQHAHSSHFPRFFLGLWSPVRETGSNWTPD